MINLLLSGDNVIVIGMAAAVIVHVALDMIWSGGGQLLALYRHAA